MPVDVSNDVVKTYTARFICKINMSRAKRAVFTVANTVCFWSLLQRLAPFEGATALAEPAQS